MLIPGLKAGADVLARVAELRLLGTLSISCVDPSSVLPLLSAAPCRVEVPPTIGAQAVRALLDAGALHGTFTGLIRPHMHRELFALSMRRFWLRPPRIGSLQR